MIPGKYRSVSGRAASNVGWVSYFFFPFVASFLTGVFVLGDGLYYWDQHL